jgi:hypothetical protein
VVGTLRHQVESASAVAAANGLTTAKSAPSATIHRFLVRNHYSNRQIFSKTLRYIKLIPREVLPGYEQICSCWLYSTSQGNVCFLYLKKYLPYGLVCLDAGISGGTLKIYNGKPCWNP